MNKTEKRLLTGAAAAVALGAVATAFLLSPAGKKAQKEARATAAGLYKRLQPKLRKLKKVTKADYEKAVRSGLREYARLKKLTLKEERALRREALGAWKKMKR